MDRAEGMVPGIDANVSLIWNFEDLAGLMATGTDLVRERDADTNIVRTAEVRKQPAPGRTAYFRCCSPRSG